MDDALTIPDDGFPPPAVGWATGPLGQVQAEERLIARATARQFRTLAAFAVTRPASADRQPGEPGSMSAARRAARAGVLAQVSEWAAEEVALALGIPVGTAQDRLERALTVVHRLPRTLVALEDGRLHLGHLWRMLDRVAPIADDTVRGDLERELLAWMGRRQVTTAAQLGAKIRRELLVRNVRDAARDLERQLRRRGVSVQADRVDGMAVLSALLTVPEAQALLDALGKYADTVVDDPADGPPRTRQQKMADCLMDLVLRPGESHLPVVQAGLTVVVPVATMAGADQPAEINGHPVPAELARSLAQGMGLLPSAGDVVDVVPVDVDPDAAVDEGAVDEEEAWWAEALAQVTHGWPYEDPPPDEQERLWEQTAAELAADPAWALPFGFAEDPGGGDPVPLLPAAAPRAREAVPSWWAAADAAVDEASQALLGLDRALTRARRAVDWAELADRADADIWEESPAARVTAASDALTALRHVSAAQRAGLADLLERTAGGGLADRPRIALTDALTGALLALTDAPGLRAAGACGTQACRTGRSVCDHDLTGRPGIGPPPESDGYRPGDHLDRFLRARDRRCRQPGCRRPVAELDHSVPHPHGPTAATNMNGFCTGHHRGKHQAPDLDYELAPAGTLIVTTTTGLTATSDPPPF